MSAINGPLYAEAMGPEDAPAMVFIHPNPMDSSSWLYQLPHFSTWFRCVAVDLPGYGRSPTSDDGLTMHELAVACWEAVERHASIDGGVVLVGCSAGSSVIQHMYHVRPEATNALVLSGTGWRQVKDFAPLRIAGFREHGLAFRYDFSLSLFSEQFSQTPLGAWFARLFSERDDLADLPTITRLLETLGLPDPDWLQRELHAPVLILSGSEDHAHQSAFLLRDRLPDARLVTMEGAGHACHIEQPWRFDTEVMSFLHTHGYRQVPSMPADRDNAVEVARPNA